MSCVVGVVHNKEIWMGADSAASDGEDLMIVSNRKIFRKGPMIIGVVGSLRMTQLLQYKLNLPPFKYHEDIYEYMVGEFVEEVRKTFLNGGIPEHSENPEHGGVFLVGLAGRIMRVENSLQVFERRDGFDAIGCGYPYALGSLIADHRLPPEERIVKALARVTYFSAHVRPPYRILREKNEEEICLSNPALEDIGASAPTSTQAG